MLGERRTQFRLFQEGTVEPSREDEQARNPDENLKSRGKIEDKIARGKEKRKVRKEIKEAKKKIDEAVREGGKKHLKFVLGQRLEGK